jgi:plastocyanin domain-containing protein
MTRQIRFIYFLLAGWLIVFVRCAREAPQTTSSPSAQEIKVTVKGEYTPDRIVVKKGSPVRLKFFRDDDSECTAQVVFPDLKVKQDLPVKQETVIAFIPEKEGEFTFACGMDMIKGKLVVEK